MAAVPRSAVQAVYDWTERPKPLDPLPERRRPGGRAVYGPGVIARAGVRVLISATRPAPAPAPLPPAGYVIRHRDDGTTDVRMRDTGLVERYPTAHVLIWRTQSRSARQRRMTLFRVLVFGVFATHPCAYCGAEVEFLLSTVDHVVPLVRGGIDRFENYVLSCKPCNGTKGAADTWRVLFPHAPLQLPK